MKKYFLSQEILAAKFGVRIVFIIGWKESIHYMDNGLCLFGRKKLFN